MVYRRVSERRALDWVLAVGIVGAVILVGYAGLQETEKSKRAVGVESQSELPYTGLPPGTYSFEIPVSESAPTEKPAVAGVVGIYECVVDGQRVFSDRDCGPGAVQRDIDTRGLSAYEPGPIPYVDMRRYRTPSQDQLGESSQVAESAYWYAERKKARCEQIQERIDWINARMRQGYTSQRGERLRAQWYDAKNAYSEARCGKPD